MRCLSVPLSSNWIVFLKGETCCTHFFFLDVVFNLGQCADYVELQDEEGSTRAMRSLFIVFLLACWVEVKGETVTVTEIG